LWKTLKAAAGPTVEANEVRLVNFGGDDGVAFVGRTKSSGALHLSDFLL